MVVVRMVDGTVAVGQPSGVFVEIVAVGVVVAGPIVATGMATIILR